MEFILCLESKAKHGCTKTRKWMRFGLGQLVLVGVLADFHLNLESFTSGR